MLPAPAEVYDRRRARWRPVAERTGAVYELVHRSGVRTLLAREAVPFTIALILAECFYKFHSFTLEALAFLLTWYALGWAANRIVRRDT